MNFRNILSALAAGAMMLFGAIATAQEAYSPTKTCKFATKDGQDLYLDYYAPAAGSETTLEGHEKPTVLFAFGGGFKGGERDEEGYQKWFRMLNDEGYPVVSIDYRLALKGVTIKKGAGQVRQFRHAAQVAAEDMLTAVKYLLDNGSSIGVDASNLVISGSSAGAIASLEADWLFCNGRSNEEFPEDFDFAGVMPFSGAIITMEGKPRYEKAPAPTAFFHGTADKVVNYKKLHIFKWGIFGSDALAKIFKKNGYTYNIFRYVGHGHEIAESMTQTFPEQLRFLETVATRGVQRSSDSLIDDPEAPKPSGSRNRKEMYGN